ncbi:alpha/beta hydrolase [Pediococcus pentosaceus]|jgi:non-heme chloroperoxidase|uniref:alpha/beta fold hydrolase n=1 Tax=Pediococcus pentosaceus TaxID=1255 RepID=UPI00211A5FE7|nr:alpha/beta hydrolase [Pediococcus pentosaceus]MCQ9197006.1 alpha/beta hydrolase [Pediococcus pentosaceus]MDE3750566.1 alpha/beta hydrolase [Pediococcus pentosaceus]
MKLKLKSGAQIFFEDEGQGTPILFLTGFGGNTEIWSGQVNFFLQRGYRVIRLDYLNHGQSDRVDGELQIGDLADEVLQLVDYLQLKEPIGIGNSMGAAVLWNIINLRGWDFLSKAIFVDQSPKMLNDQQWHLGFKNLAEDNFDEIMNEPIVRPAYKHIDDFVFKNSKAIDSAYPFSQPRNRALVKGHAKKDWRFVLEQATKPVLFIMGEKSPFFDSTKTAELSALNANIMVNVMKNVGHIPMAEDPTEFNRLVLQFV